MSATGCERCGPDAELVGVDGRLECSTCLMSDGIKWRAGTTRYRVPHKDDRRQMVEGSVSPVLGPHIYALMEKAAKWDAHERQNTVKIETAHGPIEIKPDPPDRLQVALDQMREQILAAREQAVRRVLGPERVKQLEAAMAGGAPALVRLESGPGLAAKCPDATKGGRDDEPITCDLSGDWD